MKKLVIHPWKPVYDENSRLLILGTIPSPKSRETNFYYGHPQNCFWATLAHVLGESVPASDAPSKSAFLLKHRIAVWDVLRSCEIEGASDGSISNPEANKFGHLLRESNIRAVFTTGRKATKLFTELCAEETGISPIYLPSTSPANRAMHKKPEFIKEWMKIKSFLRP